MRVINVAAAQLGPIQKAESRETVVKRTTNGPASRSRFQR